MTGELPIVRLARWLVEKRCPICKVLVDPATGVEERGSWCCSEEHAYEWYCFWL